MFNKIENASILIKNSGNYKVLDLYEYRTEVYAKNGSSYIKIYFGNITSNAKTRWISLENIEVNYKNSVLIHEQIQSKT